MRSDLHTGDSAPMCFLFPLNETSYPIYQEHKLRLTRGCRCTYLEEEEKIHLATDRRRFSDPQCLNDDSAYYLQHGTTRWTTTSVVKHPPFPL